MLAYRLRYLRATIQDRQIEVEIALWRRCRASLSQRDGTLEVLCQLVPLPIDRLPLAGRVLDIPQCPAKTELVDLHRQIDLARNVGGLELNWCVARVSH